ncbi:prohibitin family protein [Neolewinella lacunae]|uniref:Prohibitin family protein n=1 Tax=Neolewinella lacunae TaxID=1517758 RepID=A0A923PQE7_9BACT|nr:prohibitin family protein [Neolewinella lacunae]MBC6995881.1 prohibitin family protein [Neolewinella lacunae]MDN3636427.1 prohibitin family protein [Neolewinella lacunae]
MNQKKLMTFGIIAFFLFIFLIIFSNSAFITIDAGERGVLFRRFSGGLDKQNIYQPGFHMVAPWNDMYVYEVRETQLEEEMEVLSSNGLTIKVDVTARIRPNYGTIGELHETFGREYLERLVRPEVRSSVRQVIGKFTPEELYSTRRDEVQTLITEELTKVLTENYVDLRAILIRDIELPDKVRMAIEEKLEAEQGSLKYEYILTREKQEAERRLIEAEAKAAANRVLSASLSDKILQDKGIEATLELAKSPNSKVIVVGGEGGGLPLILGGGN